MKDTPIKLCPCCGHNDVNTHSFGLCVHCIYDVFLGSDDAATVVYKLTNHIADLETQVEKLKLVIESNNAMMNNIL